MKCNVGRTEQKIRIGAGIVILVLGWYFGTWWGLIGIIPLITGAVRWCPASAILGVSTCEVEDPQQE